MPAAVAQNLAAIKVKAAASSTKLEPLLPQQVDHPSQVHDCLISKSLKWTNFDCTWSYLSVQFVPFCAPPMCLSLCVFHAQLVDAVRELKREDEVASPNPTLAAVGNNYQSAAAAASNSRVPKAARSAAASDTTTSQIQKLHLDQFLSALRLEDPNVSDPYKYQRPRTNATWSAPCEQDTGNGSASGTQIPESRSGAGKEEAIASCIVHAECRAKARRHESGFVRPRADWVAASIATVTSPPDLLTPSSEQSSSALVDHVVADETNVSAMQTPLTATAIVPIAVAALHFMHTPDSTSQQHPEAPAQSEAQPAGLSERRAQFERLRQLQMQSSSQAILSTPTDQLQNQQTSHQNRQNALDQLQQTAPQSQDCIQQLAAPIDAAMLNLNASSSALLPLPICESSPFATFVATGSAAMQSTALVPAPAPSLADESRAGLDAHIKFLQDLQRNHTHQMQQFQTRSTEDQMKCMTEQQALLAELQSNPSDTKLHPQLAALMQRQQDQNTAFIAAQKNLQAQQMKLGEILSDAIRQRLEQNIKLHTHAPAFASVVMAPMQAATVGATDHGLFANHQMTPNQKSQQLHSTQPHNQQPQLYNQHPEVYRHQPQLHQQHPQLFKRPSQSHQRQSQMHIQPQPQSQSQRLQLQQSEPFMSYSSASQALQHLQNMRQHQSQQLEPRASSLSASQALQQLQHKQMRQKFESTDHISASRKWPL